MPNQKHALITGGAGFIGSHLCEHLLAKGWCVTVIDDLSTGRIENVKALDSNPDFKMIVGEAGEASLLESLVAKADTVFHLAAVVGVRKVMEDTIATIEKNLHTTEVVLRACNRYRKRFLDASSSEVYGANPKDSFSEEDNAIIGPSRYRRWCYAAAKLMDEFHAYAYYYSTALPMTIVRLFNTVGPRQVGHYGMVVPTFVNQALAGEPITIHGDGSQQRCFTYVKDVARCLVELSERKEAIGEVYNIGSTNEISIKDLAEKIKQMTGSDSPIIFKSYGEVYGETFVDMERRRPNTSKLKAAIGYAPDTSLDEILQEITRDRFKLLPTSIKTSRKT